MDEMPPINIQIDPEALKAQIEKAVAAQFGDFATRLRVAADALDEGEFWRVREGWDERERKKAYDRGFADGKAATTTEGSKP